MPMSDRPALEFIILCGFLGSGKTTLLGQFLNGRDLRDTAVIVNEAGEVGVDAAILQEQAPEDPVLMLDNGCVCCSLRSSLVDTVLRVLAAPRPSGAPPLARIVLETSGISRPGVVLATLRDRELVSWPIDFRVLCTFDASRTLDSPELQMDEPLAQWAAAQRIVVTKTDLVDTAGLEQARRSVAALNPLAELVLETERERRVLAAFARGEPGSSAARAPRVAAGRPDAMGGPHTADAPGTQGPAQADGLVIQPASSPTAARVLPHPRLRVFRGQAASALIWDDFAAWVDDLAGLLGERLLRFKAIVRTADQDEAVLLQSVGTVFAAPRRAPRTTIAEGADSSIIVIARDCEADWIDAQLPEAPVRLSAWRAPARWVAASTEPHLPA
jgi:G3E family GTPase